MDQTPSRSQRALRRLLLLLAAAAVLVIFSYGWTVTRIDLSVPQEPQRQQNVGNALRELLSPNVFQQEYEVLTATSSFVIGCPPGFAAPLVTASDQPYIIVEPACGSANEQVTVRGYNFAANGLARVNWIATDGERRVRRVLGTNNDNFFTAGDGSFAVQVEVPRIRGSAGQTHTVEVQGRFPVGLPTLSPTTGLVVEKMVETIFLALIATVVSILPSAVLSFFAAQNLMRPVRSPLGGLLVSVTLAPVGWLLGTLLLGPLGALALNVGQLKAGGSAATAGLLLFGAVASTRMGGGLLTRRSPDPRALLNALLLAVISTAAIGLIGGLGLLFGSTFRDGLIGYVGAFLASLGSLVELAMVPITGLIGAFTLMTMGSVLTRDALKHASVPVSHILGGVFGVLTGAILLGGAAAIGMTAAWLGLLPPIAAAGLSGAVLVQLYRRFVRAPHNPGAADRAIRAALSWAGMIAGFAATFLILNVRQPLVEGTLPPQLVAFEGLGITIYGYVFQAILIGAALGGAAGALAGTKASFPIGPMLYTVTRTLLNALRSIEPLIMGLVFVIWVGIGPFAGVLALALHSVASLGKLYSEQIENIDAGPIEALQSTGANRLQTIMYAVVPQIIPPYIAFTMYRWDINVRMSTIIGFVGGGGIGFLLQQQINLLRYRDAGVAVLAIAIVVSVLDYASASIRERYT